MTFIKATSEFLFTEQFNIDSRIEKNDENVLETDWQRTHIKNTQKFMKQYKNKRKWNS